MLVRGPTVRRCAWHRAHVETAEATLVGAIEQGSGPGIAVYACGRCIDRYGIVPLRDHPPESMGEPIADRWPTALAERPSAIGVRRAP